MINPKNCIGCGNCIDVCRFKAILIGNGGVEIDFKKCIHCGECEGICPEEIEKIDTVMRPSREY